MPIKNGSGGEATQICIINFVPNCILQLLKRRHPLQKLGIRLLAHKPFVMSCDISVFSANLTYSLSSSYKLMQAAADKVRNLDI
jgi:hypothetical protein